jgi:hypothetical protein
MSYGFARTSRPRLDYPCSYVEAQAILAGGRNKQFRRLPGKETYLEDHGTYIAVRYWYTEIVQFYPDGRIRLNNGGWHTMTTKYKINSCLVKTRWRVWNERGQWFVSGKVDLGDNDWLSVRVPFNKVYAVHEGQPIIEVGNATFNTRKCNLYARDDVDWLRDFKDGYSGKRTIKVSEWTEQPFPSPSAVL